jgi:nucleotide-binding universal stress UspA family protein
MKKPVLVPTDLTDVASKAIHQAGIIARKAGTSLTLLHILNEKSPSREDAMDQMKHQAANVKELTGTNCELILREGSIFDEIPAVTCDNCYDLVVIGTHGKHGIRQHLMGAHILKLVNKLHTPSLVIQDETPLLENLGPVIMPVSSHSNFRKEVDVVVMLTTLFGNEVHLYSIHKPGFDWTPQLLKNIEEATSVFESKSVRMKRIKEEQTVFSQGYSKQTLLYAASAGAGMISMMSTPSDDYYYFAAADKEALLLNDLHLPVLCTG